MIGQRQTKDALARMLSAVVFKNTGRIHTQDHDEQMITDMIHRRGGRKAMG